MLKETIAPLITQKIAELVQNRDGENFVKAFYALSRLQPITTEGLSRDDLQSSEIQNAIKESLIYLMRRNPKYFAEYRDKWVNAGVVESREELNSLPEIQEIVKQKLISLYNTNLRGFAEYRDRLAKLGIINAEEVYRWLEPAS